MKSGGFFLDQGRAIQPAYSYVMQWGIQSPKQNPGRTGGPCVQFTKQLESLSNWCMLLSSAVYTTMPLVRLIYKCFSMRFLAL